MRRSHIGGLAVAVALAGCAAGCGGDPTPDPSPTPSTTKPPSATPSASAPALPGAAAANTTAGAIAFVRYYVEMVNNAARTGDTDPLAEASADVCESCAALMQKVDALYSAGGHSEGGVWRLVEVRVTHVGRPWRVAGRVNYTAQRIVQPPNADQIFEAGEYQMDFTLIRRDEQWQVSKWVRH